MLGLFGLVGGAALEIRRLRGRGNDAQTQELKKALEQYSKDLERERRIAQAASRRAHDMEDEAAALRQTADALGRQREELAQRNAELLLTNLALDDRAQKLEGEANELALINRRLANQVEELSAARDAESERFASDMAALRDRVADVLKRMFSNEIGDEEAVEALRGLGCEVRFVPAARRGWLSRRQEEASEPSALTYVFEPPRLVLEDPARLARLMQAARSTSDSSPHRLEGPMPGSKMTPRIPGGAGGALGMQAALTMVGGSGAGGGSSSSAGVPRFVLSWLAGPADAAGSSDAASAPDVVRSVAADAAAKGVAAAAIAAAPSGSPVKVAPAVKAAPASKVPVHIEHQNGTLVFSPQGKAKAAPKSRRGLTLADAAGVFKRGGASGAQAAPSIAAPAAVGSGAAGGGCDVSSSRDLVVSRE